MAGRTFQRSELLFAAADRCVILSAPHDVDRWRRLQCGQESRDGRNVAVFRFLRRSDACLAWHTAGIAVQTASPARQQLWQRPGRQIQGMPTDATKATQR